MSKRKPLDSFSMDAFLSGKTSNTEKTPGEHRENTERTPAPYEKLEPSELVQFSIRLRAEDLAALRAHFTRIDVPISQGIRQVVLDYMSSKGLR